MAHENITCVSISIVIHNLTEEGVILEQRVETPEAWANLPIHKILVGATEGIGMLVSAQISKDWEAEKEQSALMARLRTAGG